MAATELELGRGGDLRFLAGDLKLTTECASLLQKWALLEV